MTSWRRDPADRLRAWIPAWWRGEGGITGQVLDRLLWPAEIAYRGVTTARNLAYDRGLFAQADAPIPVISVGNIGVGGAGKTPFAAWLAERLTAWGRSPAIVLRGYGADEILVHRELNPTVPVIAAPRRVDGVREAAGRGCDVAVLDDAFQHRSLARRLDLVLVAAEGWRLRPRLLPRGPWREAPEALRRAGSVVVTRKTASAAEAAEVAVDLREVFDGPLSVCLLAPTGLETLAGDGAGAPLEWLRDREVLAVASLADPRPFAAHLEAQRARVELLAFPDHHDFDVDDARRIARNAGGRPVVMTRKEAVKLRPLLQPGVVAMVLEQRASIETGAADLDAALREALL